MPEPPRMVAPAENIEAALNLLEKAQRPLVLVGKGMAWARAEDEVRSFIERTQLPFLRSPMGKGVVPMTIRCRSLRRARWRCSRPTSSS